MQYIITFLEGVITFISPCLLPMLPVYLSYFAGVGSEAGTKKTVQGALGFVLGFTLVFITLGAFAGLVGGMLQRYDTIVNIVTGALVILFGLSFLGVFNIKFLSISRTGGREAISGFFPAVLFGIVFAVCWTPCIGAFLGSALMLASHQASAFQGVILLLCFSLGLGLPFIISALLIEKLKSAFDRIKKHYKIINIVSGSLLIVLGVLMMTGLMHRLLAFFAI